MQQEIASIIKYILEKAGNPAAYYYEVPQGFTVPAVYFPPPELTSRGDTFSTYAVRYVWNIKFFHNDTVSAQQMAVSVFNAIKSERNLIPLIDKEGVIIGKGLRIKDPELKKSEEDIFIMKLTWDCLHPYDETQAQKMMVYDMEVKVKD